MRKISTFVLLLLVLSLVLSSFSVIYADIAPQQDNYDKAVKLQTIGLFKGSNKGFELERIPTRLEGAAMLVRLLGKEKLALDKNYEHPFEDVPSWASPYVGYMYENNLTSGKTPSLFGSSDPLSASQYITFILRSLGYDDTNGDFIWNESIRKAVELSIIDDGTAFELKDKVFLRGDLVSLSYSAMKAKLKNTDDTLVVKLIKDGAVPNGSDKLLNEKVISEAAADETSMIIYSDDSSAKSIYEMKDKVLLSSSRFYDANYLQVLDKNTGVIKQLIPDMYVNLIKEYKDQIYFTSPNENWDINLFKININNAENPEKVIDQKVRQFSIVNDSIYFIKGDYDQFQGIYVADLLGKENQLPLINEPVWRFQVGNDNSLIYLTVANTSYKNYSLVNTGALIRYKDGSRSIIIKDNVSNFQVYDDKLYYTTSGDQFDLYCINLDGTGKQLILENIGDFYIYKDKIFFANEKDPAHVESQFASVDIGKLYSATLNGTDLKKLTDGPADSIIAADGWVYFRQYFDTGSMNGDEGMRVPINGGQVEYTPYEVK